MGGFRRWLRDFGYKLRSRLQHFMLGRYGTDKLNMAILGAGFVFCLLSLFIKLPAFDSVMTVLSYGCMFYAIFRTFSRNTYKRYQENRKFLMLLDRLKDREHKYFECPRCRQPVRVPRGKGKISITCPKCREKFVRKS